MTFRLLLTFALLMLPATSQAADCLSATLPIIYFSGHEGYQAGSDATIEVRSDAKDRCGTLNVVHKSRSGLASDVRVSATYAEFVESKNPAELRYNEWVRKQLELVPLDSSKPADFLMPTGGGLDGQWLAISSLYRSRKLLSASVTLTVCCALPWASTRESLNIDADTGQAIAPSELIQVDVVGEACWRQFSKLEGFVDGEQHTTGDRFAKTYPLDRALSVDVDFGRALKNPAMWQFSDGGLSIRFGRLLGSTDLTFACEIPAKDLAQFTKPGISVPF